MFKQIVIVDKTGLQDWALEKLNKYSQNPIKLYDDIPTSEGEVAQRIEDADCVFEGFIGDNTADGEPVGGVVLL